MNFGSVCSGIEAASVAFPPHWEAKFYSEIEPFPCAILAKHYGCGRPDFMPSPNDDGLSVKDKRARQAAIKSIMKLPAEHKGVPNHGDMTQFEKWEIKDAIRLLCGGTPCQSFSIAGLRKGLDDQRGNLMLTYGEMAAKLRPDWLLWENVPGVLSSNKGKDFGAFLGLLSGQTLLPPKGGWGKAGIIPGYDHAYGLAYRVFDAQYFGVAQRRRRVFVVGYIGDWRPAAAVLLELDCVLGNPPPSRKAGQEASGDAVQGTEGRGVSEKGRSSAQGSYRWQNNQAGIVEDNVSATLRRESSTTDERSVAAYTSTNRMVAFGEYSEDGTASAMKARDYKDATDLVSCVRERSDVFSEEIAHCLQTTCHDHTRADGFNMVAHTLKGEGFDASEDGTGRQNLIAFSAKDYGADAMDNMAPTLRAGNHATSHANSGSWVAVAQSMHAVSFSQNQEGEVRTSDVMGTLNTNSNPSGRNTPMVSIHENQRSEVTLNDTSGALSQGGGKPGQGYSAAMVGSSVRRLTPIECERLQGFPDNYTDLNGPFIFDRHRLRNLGNMIAGITRDTVMDLMPKAKPTPDGPRYKSLGNSWAVPNISWIAYRIDYIDQILLTRKLAS